MFINVFLNVIYKNIKQRRIEHKEKFEKKNVLLNERFLVSNGERRNYGFHIVLKNSREGSESFFYKAIDKSTTYIYTYCILFFCRMIFRFL